VRPSMLARVSNTSTSGTVSRGRSLILGEVSSRRRLTVRSYGNRAAHRPRRGIGSGAAARAGPCGIGRAYRYAERNGERGGAHTEGDPGHPLLDEPWTRMSRSIGPTRLWWRPASEAAPIACETVPCRFPLRRRIEKHIRTLGGALRGNERPPRLERSVAVVRNVKQGSSQPQLARGPARSGHPHPHRDPTTRGPPHGDQNCGALRHPKCSRRAAIHRTSVSSTIA